MTENLAKEAFKEAEDSLKEKQKQVVKDIVLKTLEKLDRVRKELKSKQEEERILRMDLDDLKEGKIDRIVERQETDPKAKEVSVVIIIKEKEVIHEHHHHDYWHYPYTIVWQQPYTPVYYSGTICGNTIGTLTGGSSLLTNSVGVNNCNNSAGGLTIDCSSAKDASVGTYDVNGSIVHFR